MKPILSKVNRQKWAVYFAALTLVLSIGACHKFEDIFDHHNPGKGDKPSAFSSEVIQKWSVLQSRLMRNIAGPNHGFGRHYAYSGIAAWESIAPGMPASVQLKKEWNGLTGLPQAINGKKYYWPANANAALAAINRSFFPNANALDKAAIDSLENALNDEFLTKTTSEALQNSAQFGKLVAMAVWNWAETDGIKTVNPPYVVPVGDGLWKPTAPGQVPATPYWGNNRPVVKGSTNGTFPSAPPAYSTVPGSAFHNMAKEVHDAGKAITPAQKEMAIFWRDVPGGTTPGHWLSILQQVLDKENASLAKGALAYALTGAGINDAAIAVFKAKYHFNLVRPVTYIREVMGDTAWAPTLGTPGHPEYVSAHSSLSMAVGATLEKLFGGSGTFTDHTYDYLGLPARSYTSYSSIAEEAGNSRLYAGIHYQFSIDKGLWQGKKVASNILDRCPSFGF
jgi:hypothetical protein